MAAISQERPVRKALRPLLACSWTNSADPTGRLDSLRIVPDACIDLIWRSDGAVQIAGPDTAPRFTDGARDRYHGIRFRPGVAPAVLGLPATELRDQTVDLADVWDAPTVRRLEDAIWASPETARDLLEDAVADRLKDAPEPDPAVIALVDHLQRERASIHEIAADLGLSERQLRRRCEAAVGYGPKLLAEVLRFQHVRALASRRVLSLAELAQAAGYADQSHLNREYRRFGGATPAELLPTGRDRERGP